MAVRCDCQGLRCEGWAHPKYINHFERDAPCGPRRMNLCKACHSDLLGHALGMVKGNPKGKSKGLEFYLGVQIGLSQPVLDRAYNVLSSCINCCSISQVGLKKRIRELCAGRGVEESEVDSFIRWLGL